MQCYSYRFVQNLKINDESSSILKRSLYSFKSTRSNQTYHVIVDNCLHNVNIIKFYLKSHRHSKRRYNVLTNLNEPRNVIFTCMNILNNEIHKKDNTASFGFVASNLPHESMENTKRFRIYDKFISTFIGSETFEHFSYIEWSAYVLIPKNHLVNNPTLSDQIFSLFKEHDFVEQ